MNRLLHLYTARVNDGDVFSLRQLFTPTATLRVGVASPFVVPMLTLTQRQCLAQRVDIELAVPHEPTSYALNHVDVNVTWSIVSRNEHPKLALAFRSEDRFEFSSSADQCLISQLWWPW